MKHSAAYAKTISVEETSLPHPETFHDASIRLKALCPRLLSFIRQRHGESGEVPRILRLSVYDKAAQGLGSASRQMQVDAAVFSSCEALTKSAHVLLRQAFKPSAKVKMRLSRVNLAAAGPWIKVDQLQACSLKFSGKPSSSTDHLTRNTWAVNPDDVDKSILAELPADIRKEIVSGLKQHTKRKLAKQTVAISKGSSSSSSSPSMRCARIDSWFVKKGAKRIRKS